MICFWSSGPLCYHSGVLVRVICLDVVEWIAASPYGGSARGLWALTARVRITALPFVLGGLDVLVKLSLWLILSCPVIGRIRGPSTS